MAMTASELIEALQEFVSDSKTGGVWVEYEHPDNKLIALDGSLPTEVKRVWEDHGTIVLSL